MAEEDALPVCHCCDEEAELLVNIPPMDGEQPTCRQCLRRLDRMTDAKTAVDAKTWLETGYAAWLLPGGTHGGEPLPKEPRHPENQRLREELDEQMGWYDA